MVEPKGEGWKVMGAVRIGESWYLLWGRVKDGYLWYWVNEKIKMKLSYPYDEKDWEYYWMVGLNEFTKFVAEVVGDEKRISVSDY